MFTNQFATSSDRPGEGAGPLVISDPGKQVPICTQSVSSGGNEEFVGSHSGAESLVGHNSRARVPINLPKSSLPDTSPSPQMGWSTPMEGLGYNSDGTFAGSLPGMDGMRNFLHEQPPRRFVHDNTIICPYEWCNTTFKRSNDLVRHLATASVHRASTQTARGTGSTEPSTTCSRCGEMFSRPDARKRHELRDSCRKLKPLRKDPEKDGGN